MNIIKVKTLYVFLKYFLFLQTIAYAFGTMTLFLRGVQFKVILLRLVFFIIYISILKYFLKTVKDIYVNDKYIKLGKKGMEINKNRMSHLALGYGKKDVYLFLKDDENIQTIFLNNYNKNYLDEIEKVMKEYRVVNTFRYLEKLERRATTNIEKYVSEIFEKIELSSNKIVIKDEGLEHKGDTYAFDKYSFDLGSKYLLINDVDNNIVEKIEFSALENKYILKKLLFERY
ncbi:hypothetical protein STFE110948_04780 [Streptobacillus felis]|uniref:hypothetical protein n=1 Tax=Streptobacillus felis TaxID=1384509 RepID=UPI0039EAB466